MTEFLTRIFVKNHEDVSSPAVRNSYGTFAGITGIIINLILCTVKITAGLLTGSISVTADGLNNLSDMGSSVITIIGFRLAGKPADADHPFGHGRMEYVSGFTVALLILLVGIELIKESLTALFSGEAAPEYGIAAVIILAVSVLLKFWLFIFNRKLASKIKSDSLATTAKDSINDVLATSVILIAVLVSAFVTLPFNLDAVMGVGVGIFILFSGISAAKDTLDEILGKPPTKEFVSALEETVMSFGVFLGIHDLIVHDYGPGRCFASVHVEVPQSTDIVKCHEQIDLCEKTVNEKFGIILVIHMDPIDTDNKEVAKTKAEMAEMLKSIHPDVTIHDFRMTPKSEGRTNLIFDIVIPHGCAMTDGDVKAKAGELAKEINPSFVCVITVDRDYT